MNDYEAAWKTAQTTIKFANQEIHKLEQQNAEMREALEKLFQAYQTLDEDTMPADTLPLEQIQDIMPEIEQALGKEE